MTKTLKWFQLDAQQFIAQRSSNHSCCIHVSNPGNCQINLLYPHGQLPKAVGSCPTPYFETSYLYVHALLHLKLGNCPPNMLRTCISQQITRPRTASLNAAMPCAEVTSEINNIYFRFTKNIYNEMDRPLRTPEISWQAYISAMSSPGGSSSSSPSSLSGWSTTGSMVSS